MTQTDISPRPRKSSPMMVVDPPAESTPAPIRSKRKPFGQQQQKLAYPARPGYHRHWFNDDGRGRIDRAKEAGYEHVKSKEGDNVKLVVGVSDGGTPLTAYLMEIIQEWYDEDMAAQQKLVDEVDHAIRGGNIEGKVGQDGRYIPSRGIKIGTK